MVLGSGSGLFCVLGLGCSGFVHVRVQVGVGGVKGLRVLVCWSFSAFGSFTLGLGV